MNGKNISSSPENNKQIKSALIKLICRHGEDIRLWNKFNKLGWTCYEVHGELRKIHKVLYHFEGNGIYIDDLEYSTAER